MLKYSRNNLFDPSYCYTVLHSLPYISAASEAGKDVADQVTDAHVAAENVSTLLPSLREKCSKFESEASALR
jgi:hypothetical protein